MSANFDPTMGNFKNMSPFKMWCQKVLPLTYDDSLSYYEVLCKLKNFLNEVIENMDVLHDDVDALHLAYQQLEGYVNSYFDNLSVQTEINNKLDAMALDGSLSDLIEPFVTAKLPTEVSEQIGGVVADQIGSTVAGQIGDVVGAQLPDEVSEQAPTMVTSWLNDHVNPQSEVVIDDSLSIEGAAADAKATGDAISLLNSALTNIRNSTGIEIVNMYSLSECLENSFLVKTTGATQVLNGRYVSAFIPVTVGVTYYLQGVYTTGTAVCGYSSADENAFIGSITPVNVKYEKLVSITPTTGMTHIRFNVSTSNTTDTWMGIGANYEEKTTHEIATKIRTDGNNVIPFTMDTSVISGLKYVNAFDLSKSQMTGYYFMSTDQQFTANASYNCTYYIPVKPNTLYYVKGFYTGAGSYGFFDKDKTFIGIGTKVSTDNYNAQITSPNNARYAVFSWVASTTSKLIVSEFNTDDDSYVLDIYKRLGVLEYHVTPWHNKNVLVFGDSISTKTYHYAGNPEWDKWPDILSAYKGFTLTNDSIAATGFIATTGGGNNSLVDRISAQTGTYDLILIFMGINDAIQHVEVGSIETISSENPKANFYSAVDYCLKYLFEHHTASKVGLLLPLPTSGQHDAVGSTPYIDCLIERCKYYDVPYLDLRYQSGFRPYISEFRAMFTEQGGDGVPDGIHPNQAWDNGYLSPMIGEYMDKFVLS